MVWLDDFCPRVEILFVECSLGGYLSKGPKFLCKYWARGGWSKCSSLSCVTLPLLMDVLLHLEFLNPQVQCTPTSSECPQPWVPQVGGLNQVQLESHEGHSQTFASPPLHVLWPARIGPVPPGCLYLRQYEENRYDKIFTRCHLCTPAPCKCLLLRVDYSTCKLPKAQFSSRGWKNQIEAFFFL